MYAAVMESAAAERAALRHRRDRLTARSALLHLEAERLTDSDDAEALRALSGQLCEHSAVSSPTITRWNSFTCGLARCSSKAIRQSISCLLSTSPIAPSALPRSRRVLLPRA
jgi:hypothetical protein